jgi:MoxR-like ATPase
VFVDELIEDYIVSLVTATRHHEDSPLGASAVCWRCIAPQRAAISGRDYVIPDDVKLLAEPGAGTSLDHQPGCARIRNHCANCDERYLERRAGARAHAPAAALSATRP